MRMLKKITSILKDESGAALVVTVSVFLFIYLAILGVYAIGMNVRNRIHLQNACDAAAYSAAVVQADALSRIATLNRAMSWTYCQMTKRQMDYIIYKWLRHTVQHYRDDKMVATASGSRGRHNHKKAWIGVGLLENYLQLDSVDEHGKKNSRIWNIENVDRVCSQFPSHITRSRSSFYSPNSAYGNAETRLRHQLIADKRSIRELNDSIDVIKSELQRHVDSVIQSSANANLPDDFVGVARIHAWHAHPNRYMRKLKSTEEAHFRNFAGDVGNNGFTPKRWFDLDQEIPLGLCRNYSGGLVSRWSWWSKKWICPAHHSCFPVYVGSCPHKNCWGDDVCSGWPIHKANLEAGNLKDGFYDGERAFPQVLTKEYFGSAGTITVGIAVPNSNPFARIIGSVSGIFSAFNPGAAKTVCFSSAKAGYGRILGDANNNRCYSIDWNDDQSWNLCQSDWDAVFVPVRRAGPAGSKAEKGAWQGDVAPFLGDLAERLGIGKDDFKAGKTVPSSQAKYVRYLQDDKDGIEGGPVRWRVKNPGAAVDWSGLHNRMFH